MTTKECSKTKRKSKPWLGRDSRNFILLLVALQSAHFAGGWALYRESRAEMNSGFDRLDARITNVAGELRVEMSSMEDGLRADMKSMGDGLRADMKSMEDRLRAEINSVEIALRTNISGLRTDVSGLTERIARLEATNTGSLATDQEPPEEE